MSYSETTKQNANKANMPQPDQALRDGNPSAEQPELKDKMTADPSGIHPKVSEAIPQNSAEWEDHMASTDEIKEQYNQAGQNIKKGAEKVEKKVKSGADKAEKEIKSAADKTEREAKKGADKVERGSKDLANKARNELDDVESALGPYWEKTKDIVLRPGALGGLMGVVNVGILGTLGYYAYTRWNERWDQRYVGGIAAGTLALFGAEGLVTDSYLSTEEGQAEARRAKREGSKFYNQARERVLRPGVAGGLIGVVNIAVLGTVGYFSYQNWNRRWEPRTVTAVAAGLVALSGLEGYAGKAVADNN